jgi:hypothetical protein
VTLDHAVDLFVAVEEELQADPKSMHGLVSRAEQAHPVDHAGDTAHVDVVFRRLGGDVVTEPFRLFMRVRMTTDVDEQCGVVGRRPEFLVETEDLGQAQRDEALAQDVLHRLTEAEVDTE